MTLLTNPHNRAEPYAFLVDTCATERIKTLSVWSHFSGDDLAFRPKRRAPARGRRRNVPDDDVGPLR